MSTYLIHTGVKGMKWGIRRYQNEDGTLTDAGKARYREDGTKITSTNATNKELDAANSRLIKERNYNNNLGKDYHNPGEVKRDLIAIGASTVGSFVAGFSINLIKERLKLKPDEKTKKVKLGKEQIGKSAIMGLGTAALGAIVSTTTAVGGQVQRSLGKD